MTISLTQHCFNQLKQAIVNGEFLPGKLLRIEQLKQRYHVGGSPIREALSRLVSMGLVKHRGKAGFSVMPASEQTVRDAYQTFSQMEGLALRQAIALGDEQWEADIISALHKLRKVEQGDTSICYEIWNEYNYSFPFALVKWL